jgi:hypothetical protein
MVQRPSTGASHVTMWPCDHHVGSGVALPAPIPLHTTSQKRCFWIPRMGVLELHNARKHRVGSGVAPQPPISLHTVGQKLCVVLQGPRVCTCCKKLKSITISEVQGANASASALRAPPSGPVGSWETRVPGTKGDPSSTQNQKPIPYTHHRGCPVQNQQSALGNAEDLPCPTLLHQGSYQDSGGIPILCSRGHQWRPWSYFIFFVQAYGQYALKLKARVKP